MTNTEKLFEVLDETSEILRKEEALPYLEALAESGENLFQHDAPQPLAAERQKQLEAKYREIDLEQMKPEEVRKALQLAVLKGMREATQPHHEMTPDAVALFIGYLVHKVTNGKERFSILDPAVGSGNLLTAVLNGTSKPSSSYAVEVDETLLKLAFVNANLQKHNTEFFHQDSLQPLLIDPVDVVVCDLPVGYYPNEEMATRYELKAESGRSYAHHLMIEQSLNHTKDGGFLLFLIPNGLFQSDQAAALKKYVNQQAVIQGVLQLPLSMFKKEKHAKSIFLLQKKAPGIKPPSQVLLANLPGFTNQGAMQDIMQKIDAWFQKELG
ncbi:MAG TPA: class I SAM-dependent methyltransferase [Bacillales bacterium]|nr:class I SAM-dependent methyltransferase [Bacillales bacterium]